MVESKGNIYYNRATLFVVNSKTQIMEPELQLLTFVRFVRDGFNCKEKQHYIYSFEERVFSNFPQHGIYFNIYSNSIYYYENNNPEHLRYNYRIGLSSVGSSLIDLFNRIMNTPEVKIILGAGMYYEDRKK